MTTLRLPVLAVPLPWVLWAGLLLATVGSWPEGLWLRALLWAPLVEELCLRQGLQRAVSRRWGPVAALWASACVFAALHVLVSPGWLAALTLLPALAIGWAYRHGHGLGSCVLLHALANWLWWSVGYRLFS